jgi:hypothetical protein
MIDPHCRVGLIKPKGNVSLFPGTRAPDLPVNLQPHSEIIAMLRGLLDKAERGHVQGVAINYVNEFGQSLYNWTGAENVSCSQMIGSLILAAQEIGAASLARMNKETGDQPK